MLFEKDLIELQGKQVRIHTKDRIVLEGTISGLIGKPFHPEKSILVCRPNNQIELISANIVEKVEVLH